MPVKNAQPFLTDCIKSILSQTETDWELVAVNDGSTDNSKAILEQFAQADKRIHVLENNGAGIIAALRLAYSKSQGNLITRMDADDIMPPIKLETLKRNLLSFEKSHVAVGQVKYFSEEGLKDGYRYYESWLNGLTKNGTNYSDIYRECVIPSPCWMVFREDLDKCGAFDSDVYPEDYDLCFRFYGNGLKPIPNSDMLHHWRDHSSRSSRNDPNYTDNRFLDLKLYWFLKLDHQPEKTLVVWGAASKGKSLAKGLQKAGVDFRWMCNNPNKINKHVYDTLIENVEGISDLSDLQVLVAVANKNEQADIRQRLTGEESFFFC